MTCIKAMNTFINGNSLKGVTSLFVQSPEFLTNWTSASYLGLIDGAYVESQEIDKKNPVSHSHNRKSGISGQISNHLCDGEDSTISIVVLAAID